MPSQEPTQHRIPIRGWLAVFVGAELVAFAGHLAGCFAQLDITGAREITPAFVPAIQLDLIHVVWMVVIAVGIKRIVQRHERTRKYWIVGLIVSVPVIVYQMLLSYQLLVMTSGQAGADSSSLLRGTLVRLVFAAVWIGYWARSSRVRQTFARTEGRPGLDVPAPAT